MTTPEEQPTVGDFLARLEFKYDNDVLDFLKTGKGVVVVEDKVANIPLPQGEKGDRGDIGKLREGDVRYLDQRTDEAEAAAEASKTSETNARASEEAAKTSETNAKTSETNAAKSESAAKTSETKAKSSETEASKSASDAHTYRQGALTYQEGSKDHREAADAAQAAAKTSETNAKASETNAKTSETNAKTSETNAATSASATSEDANRAAGSATKAEQEAEKAEGARTDTEAVEQALRTLLEDTESWNEVTAAISRLDTRIADGMQQVKDDILGGVGPAYDTLLELAEAFGDNQDAIASITDELAKKASEGHTHTSADITDAYHYMGTANDAGKVVKTHTDGHVYMRTDPPEDDALARKKYVDDKTENKAEIGHQHVVSDTSGLQEALDGKSGTDHAHTISDTSGLQEALDGKSGTGHTHGISDTSGLQEALDGKSGTDHAHTISDTSGLQEALDGKSGTGHTHNLSEIRDVDEALGKKANADHTHKLTDLRDADPTDFNSAVTSAALPSGDLGGEGIADAIQNLANQATEKAEADHGHELSDLPSSSLDKPDTLIQRNHEGLSTVADPKYGGNIANKGYVDTALSGKADNEALGQVTTALGGLSFVVVTALPSNPDPDVVYLVVEE